MGTQYIYVGGHDTSRLCGGDECGTAPCIPVTLTRWGQHVSCEGHWLKPEVQSAAGVKNYVYAGHWCPGAAITKDCKLGGLTWQMCVLS